MTLACLLGIPRLRGSQSTRSRLVDVESQKGCVGFEDEAGRSWVVFFVGIIIV